MTLGRISVADAAGLPQRRVVSESRPGHDLGGFEESAPKLRQKSDAYSCIHVRHTIGSVKGKVTFGLEITW